MSRHGIWIVFWAIVFSSVMLLIDCTVNVLNQQAEQIQKLQHQCGK